MGGADGFLASHATRLHRGRSSGGMLRAVLLLLIVARTAQPVAARRALRSVEGPPNPDASAADNVCCEVQLLSPFIELDAVPVPGTRFDAARARALRCSPVAACGGEATTLLPTAELRTETTTAADPQRPFSLTMRMVVPAGKPPTWPDEKEARAPPADALLPAGTWTHFAGDSLLRGVYSTLTQYLRQRRWEEWQGASCCWQVQRARSTDTHCPMARRRGGLSGCIPHEPLPVLC